MNLGAAGLFVTDEERNLAVYFISTQMAQNTSNPINVFH
jgi:hypothetical protein